MESRELSDVLTAQDAVGPIVLAPPPVYAVRSSLSGAHISLLVVFSSPLPYTGVLYIPLRSAVRLIGVINAVPPVCCPVRPTITSGSRPGGTLHPSFKHCCSTHRDTLPPPASRALGRSQKHVPLRFASTSCADIVHASPTPSRRMPSPALRPTPVGCPRCVEQCTRLAADRAVVVDRAAPLSACSE